MSDEVTCDNCRQTYEFGEGHRCPGFNLDDIDDLKSDVVRLENEIAELRKDKDNLFRILLAYATSRSISHLQDMLTELDRKSTL